MRKSIIISLLLLPVIVLGQYTNPVIPGFYPDPSVCRVGDDYYLVNSSFQYFPGVPIFHSRDLIHWEQIGNVLDRDSQLPLSGTSSWQGIYAPTIRYNDGVYYMITTNVSHGGNFIVTARDPRGPWSEPIWVKQGGIDPSLYFEDGRCFMVSNPSDAIWLCELNPLTGEQLTESRKIWQGMGGRYPEAPHLYKKDGYYYLLIAEGGTEYGHSMTIARSRAIEGPYEGNPDNPILCHQRQATQGSPIQGTGHGDFVQAADGSWWCVFLAFRTYGGNYHHLGRETFLAPVEWNEGEWPVVNGNGTVDTLMNVRTLPQVPLPTKPNSYDFAAYRKFGPEWIFIQNPDRSKYEFTPNALRLHVSESDLQENRQPTFVGQRQVSADVDISSTVDVAGLRIGAEAGLVVYQINNGYYRLYLQRDAQGTHVMLGYRVRSLANDREIMLTKATKVRLHISSDGNMYNFACQDLESGARADGGGFECAMISTEVAGGFTGVTIGMYAVGAADGGYADFTNIAY